MASTPKLFANALHGTKKFFLTSFLSFRFYAENVINALTSCRECVKGGSGTIGFVEDEETLFRWGSA